MFRPFLAYHQGESNLVSVMTVPVAARSKEYVCGRSPAEIVGSIPIGGMDICLS